MRRKSSWPRGGAFDFENKNTEVWQGESESPARSSRQSLCSCLHNVAPDSITAYPRWCGQDCENGDCTLAHCCERISSPVGLNLGGDGPEAIALAVAAEVQAWHNGKLAASRRLTPERVAEHTANRTSSRYLPTECAVK